jgi:hypothetical protein
MEIFFGNLHSNRFEDEFLLQNLISFGCDGASYVFGRYAGIAQHLVEKYPNLIFWHCSNHCLELALDDVSEWLAVSRMKTFFDSVCCLQCSSQK